MRPFLIVGLLLLIAVPFLAQQVPNPTLKVDVDMVLVNLSVTDSLGRYVVGLDEKNFDVWEDKIEQRVEYFSTEDAPVTVGLIFDASSSMRPMLSYARDAALAFLNTSNASDEYFLVAFNERPKVMVDLTTDLTRLQTQIIFIPAKGSTALYDAVYIGIDKLKKAANPKKALITITDGEENHSRYSFTNLKEFVKEQNVQIFSIGAWGPINNLVDLTGGYAFHGDDIADICQKIAIELRNEYIIGYRSTNGSKDGKWRKISVKVAPPPGLGKLNVRAKGGYYAPGS
jgi:Ca-activated chloride channel family protein